MKNAGEKNVVSCLKWIFFQINYKANNHNIKKKEKRKNKKENRQTYPCQWVFDSRLTNPVLFFLPDCWDSAKDYSSWTCLSVRSSPLNSLGTYRAPIPTLILKRALWLMKILCNSLFYISQSFWEAYYNYIKFHSPLVIRGGDSKFASFFSLKFSRYVYDRF